jgi:hypothetical protein
VTLAYTYKVADERYVGRESSPFIRDETVVVAFFFNLSDETVCRKPICGGLQPSHFALMPLENVVIRQCHDSEYFLHN